MTQVNETTPDKPTGYIALIRTNANFRSLWFGQIVRLCGDWFNLIASAALVATLTKSGLAVGGLFMIRMLAPFLASPVAGVVADRVNRKLVLLWADVLRGCRGQLNAGQLNGAIKRGRQLNGGN